MNTAWIFGYAKPYQWRLLLCVLLMMGQSATLLAMPWLAGKLSGEFLSKVSVDVGWLAMALVGLFAAQLTFQIIRSFVLTQVSQSIVADLRKIVYQHVQDLPFGFHLKRQRGEIISLVTLETERLGNFINGPLLSFLPQVLTLIGALVLMIRLDPLMAIPIAFGVPTAAVLAKLLGGKFRSTSNDWRSAYTRMFGQVESNFSMLPMIKSFAQEREALERYAKQVDELCHVGIRMARQQAIVSPVMQFGAATAVVCFLWINLGRLQSGTVQTAELVSFLLYAVLLTRPVAALANLWGQTQAAQGSLERLQQVLALATEPLLVGKVPKTVDGDIVFDGVTFSYDDREPSLKGLDLRIPAGETVAITGENGAGKTTLVELLMRFHSPQEGRIFLDGADIQDLQLKALRSAIGFVPQRAYLFDGTVRQNILFGSPGASREKLERAAETAQATGFISALPNGYDTIIGDKGVKLSGGERQRLALARALIKDPPILILDEPTAMFDPKGERSFVEDARDALGGRTVILITHRPASLALADRIVTLGAGRIIGLSGNADRLQTGRATENTSTAQGGSVAVDESEKVVKS